MQTSQKVRRLRLASGGLRVSPPPQRPPSAALCCRGRQRRCSLGPLGSGPRADTPSPLRPRKTEAPATLPVPLPRGIARAGVEGTVRFQKAAKPQERLQLAKSRETAGASLPYYPPYPSLLSSAHQPLGGDKRPGCGRFLNIVFFLEMEALLPATWQESEVPGRWGQHIPVRAGGGLGLAGGGGGTRAAQPGLQPRDPLTCC